MQAATENDHGAPRILRAEPQIFVRDVTLASDFYRAKLGFRVVFLHGTPPYYGQVARGESNLNLRCVPEPVPDVRLRDREELLSAAMVVERIEGLANEFNAAGVDFYQPLARQPWGAQTFIVRDLDGNLLLFAQ